jgi:hypothetical protein
MNPELDLTSLKQGDRVGIANRTYESYSTGTVYRLTTTQVVISVATKINAPLHRKFRLKDGGEVGVGYGSRLVHPDDQYLIACVARELFGNIWRQAETRWRQLQTRKPGANVGPVQVWEQLQLLKAEITQAQQKVEKLIERLPPSKTVQSWTCTDCTWQTSDNLDRYKAGMWCKDIPGNPDCVGFLLGALA